MAEARVQDMQDPPWTTEDGLALCAGRLQLDEFASFGFGEAELDSEKGLPKTLGLL